MTRLLAGAALALVLVVAATVRWSPPPTVADLRPRPDALEYEEAARSLAAGRGYVLEIDGQAYPPRYPPGFPLMMAPVLAVAGDAPGTGVWVVWASALVAVAGTAWLATLAAGPLAGVAAALVLALLPMHVSWSRAVMSDVPASAVVVVAAAWATAALGRTRLGAAEWLGLGVMLGLATALRDTCVLVAGPIGLLLATGGRPGRRRLAAFAAGVAAGVLPLVVYRGVRFGSPLADGYGYWVTFAHHGLQYVFGRPAAGGSEPNLVFYLRQLAGLGSLYPWPLALLAVVGLVFGVRRAGPTRTLAVIAGGYVVLVLAVYAPFFWQWDRFLVPALPLVCALAAVPLGDAEPIWQRVAGGALLALGLGIGLTTATAFEPPNPATGEAVRLELLGTRLEPNAAVMVRTNVFFAERFLRRGTDRVWLPIGRCEHREQIARHGLVPLAATGGARGWIRDALAEPFRPDDAVAAIDELLAEGRPVYLSNILEFQTPHLPALVELLRGRYFVEPVTDRATPGLWRVRASR